MISSALCRACRLLPTGERILNFCEEYPSRFLHRFGLSAQSFQLVLFILQREFDLVKATPFQFKQSPLFRKIIKKFQRDTNIIFIVISSFNRANYMQYISVENFKESGNSEYTADVVWALQLNILDSIYPAKQLIVSNDRASKKIFNLTLDDLHDWIAQHKPIDFLEIQRHKKFGEIIFPNTTFH